MGFRVTRSEGIGELVLNHPPVNAFDGEMLAELARLMSELGDDPKTQVVILRAEGKCFCAGIDIKALAGDPGSISAVNRGAFNAFEAVHRCKVPVIAAVHGFALGAGIGLVGACDIVFAAKGSKFGLPEINVGMLGGASHMLRMLPLHKVRALYYTGEPVDADEMYRLGAVESVVDADQLYPTAMAMAEKIASKNPAGLRFAKEALNGIEPVDLERNYRYEQGFTFEISSLPDGQTSREAFRKSGD